MLLTWLAVTCCTVAAVTDAWRHKIYNWTTYTGALVALAINAAGSATGLAEQPEHSWTRAIGWIGLGESLTGLLACGFIMLACYVFFPNVGGGDVKLLTSLGAFLGLHQGIETLLWTFVLGAAAGLCLLVWRVGLWTLLVRVGKHLLWSLRLASWSKLTEGERQQLQTPLFLAPSTLAALLIVRFGLLDFLR